MTEPISARALSFVVPALLLYLILLRLVSWAGAKPWSPGRCRLLLLASLGVFCLPVGGLSLARWVAGIVPGFSVPFTVLLLGAVLRSFGHPALLRPNEWRTAWFFGAAAGIALYPLALGLGPVDPYSAGWQFSSLFAVVGLLSAGLIWCGNRFGWVLLLAIAGWHLRLLDSANYWDYLVDPVYFLVALPLAVAQVFRVRPAGSPVA